MPVFCETYDENRTPACDVDVDSLEALGLTIFRSNKYCFEKIGDAGEICNFYADIDVKFDGNSGEFMELREHAADAFRQSGFHWTDGSYIAGSKAKISFHVFDRRIQIYKSYFDWTTDYGKKMKERLFENFHPSKRLLLEPGLDNSVYKGHRWMRTPYSTTAEKPHPHVPGKDACVSEYLITALPSAINVDPEMKAMAQFRSRASAVFSVKQEESEEEASDPERLDKMLAMLGKIKSARFREYKEWFRLLCLCRGNGVPLAKFEQLSRESGYERFSEEACRSSWYKMDVRRTVGFPTLCAWLEEDGVDWRALGKKDSVVKAIIASIKETGKPSDMRVAEAFYEAYKDSLYLTPAGWLHYSDGWSLGDESSIVYPAMRVVGERFIEFLDEQGDEKWVKAYRKHAAHLCSYAGAKAVVKTAAVKFRNDTVLDEFDRYPTWFCFSDQKAIDMLTGEVIQVKKEHKILSTCGYPMPERSVAEVHAARAVVESIVGDRWESITSALAYQFRAGNPERILFVHQGSGANGKSILGNLQRAALGLYSGLLPVEQLTQAPNGRDPANSAIAQMAGKRYAQVNEPEDSSRLSLQVGRVKELSGEPDIQVRDLYAKSRRMRLDFTMSILCNDIPKLSKSDEAIAQRIKVISYPFKFVEEPCEPHHRQRDDNIKTRSESDPSLHRGYLYLMLDVFRSARRFISSEHVVQDSKAYLLDNNLLKEWSEGYIESTSWIRQKELSDEFKAWCAYNRKEAVGARKFTELALGLGWRKDDDPVHGSKWYVSKL